jgi:hypothetical protein
VEKEGMAATYQTGGKLFPCWPNKKWPVGRCIRSAARGGGIFFSFFFFRLRPIVHTNTPVEIDILV